MIKVYEKNKKNHKKIILEINENKIVLKDPQIQPYNEYVYRGPKDILYFYYTLEIYENINYFYSNNINEEDNKKIKPKWKKITESMVYEFGIVPSIPDFIDEVIKFNINDDKYKEYFIERNSETDGLIRSKTDYECSHTLMLNGICDEDNLFITKFCRYFEQSYDVEKEEYSPKYVEYYKIFIGCGNNQIKGNTTGIYAIVNEKELLEIKKWAKLFLKYAGKVTTKQIKDNYKKKIDNYFYPFFLKKHLKEKYPEDICKLKEIYEQLYEETSVLEEYYNYCKGQTIKNPITLTRNGEKISAKKYMDLGMKDYEAYLELTKQYRAPFA